MAYRPNLSHNYTQYGIFFAQIRRSISEDRFSALCEKFGLNLDL